MKQSSLTLVKDFCDSNRISAEELLAAILDTLSRAHGNSSAGYAFQDEQRSWDIMSEIAHLSEEFLDRERLPYSVLEALQLTLTSYEYGANGTASTYKNANRDETDLQIAKLNEEFSRACQLAGKLIQGFMNVYERDGLQRHEAMKNFYEKYRRDRGKEE